MAKIFSKSTFKLGFVEWFGAGLAAAALSFLSVLLSRPRDDLRGKTVLITGGSRGLGLALARRCARAGARVSICARDERELNLAASELARTGASIHIWLCDVGDEGALARWIHAVREKWGAIDVLINNAGVIQVGPMNSMDQGDFETAMDVNFWGMVNSTRQVLPSMLEQGMGQLINITSIGGVVPVPHLVPYTCSKFAAVGFSAGASVELAGTGVQVMTVIPGLMRTGSFLHALFKGRRQSELTWFSLSSSAPLISMSVERAARRIIEAYEARESWVVLGVQAKISRFLFALFPSWFMSALAGVNQRVLPASPEHGSLEERLPAKPGLLYRSRFSSPPYTVLGDRAARRYGEASGL